MKLFKLPDLGEGLQEAEIVQWHVQEGDEVEADSPLVSLETAKAVVEVPAPWSGRVSRLFGQPGDLINTGDSLVAFDIAGESAKPPPADSGTVVGKIERGEEVLRESAQTAHGERNSGVRATPAVRALARRLEVELEMVTPSGPNGSITSADVQRVAKILSEVGPMERLRGVRRAMARTMTQAHREVVAVTVTDDVDIDSWSEETDTTLRLIRAIVLACRAEPSLNAWYDSHAMGRRILQKIDLGIAVDTPDGLFAPVLRNVGQRDDADLRIGLENLKAAVRARSIPPEELRGATVTLSNFGTIAGRYATPIVVPPTVAIVGVGKRYDGVVASGSDPAVHSILPLSITFDHRCVTGGEAARFLAVLGEDLRRSE